MDFSSTFHARSNLDFAWVPFPLHMGGLFGVRDMAAIADSCIYWAMLKYDLFSSCCVLMDQFWVRSFL
jgi:hypothetical protein